MTSKPHGYLITDGTLNTMTSAVVVDNPDELQHHIKLFVERTGVPKDSIIVNEISKPIDAQHTAR